jgi:predicted DNA-binding transcriptional regulator YafY
VQAPPGRSGRRAGRDVLVQAALACRANEAIRIRHRRYDTGHATTTEVQPHRLGTRFPMPEPPPDAAAFVSDALAHGPWRHRIRVRVHTSPDLVRELVDPSVATVIDDGDECELHLGTDDLDWAARWLAYLNLDVDVIEPTALSDHLHTLGRWLVDRY